MEWASRPRPKDRHRRRLCFAQQALTGAAGYRQSRETGRTGHEVPETPRLRHRLHAVSGNALRNLQLPGLVGEATQCDRGMRPAVMSDGMMLANLPTHQFRTCLG